jgi:microsomal prostaglandin-E synthase 2
MYRSAIRGVARAAMPLVLGVTAYEGVRVLVPSYAGIKQQTRFSSDQQRLFTSAPVLLSTSFCAGRESEASKFPVFPDIEIQIYQYAICPYCHLVKSSLDFLGLPYKTVEVNPLTKSEIKFLEEPRKVPVVLLDGDVARESIVIVNRVKEILLTKGADKKAIDRLFTPDTDHWMQWAGEQLAVKIYPNITRNFSESWQAFEYTGKVDTWTFYDRYLNRVLGPVAMFFANGKVKKKYNIIDERAELAATIREWTLALKGQKFLHGDSVTMPDVVVYGVLHAVEGFDTFNVVMREDAALREWYVRVADEISHRQKHIVHK